jgi:hypothetical protein
MNISNKYFLTPKKKQKILKKLERHIANGFVDVDFIPYLSIVNSIPGIVSLSCCTGHGPYDTGNIFLQISKKMFQKLFLGGKKPMWCYYLFAQMSFDFFDNKCRIHFTWKAKNFEEAIKLAINLMRHGVNDVIEGRED